MSACDEGWDSYPDRIQEKQFCPAAIKVFDDVDGICGCGLFVWHEWQPLPWKDKKLPDTCPYAPILKKLAEAKEVKSGNDTDVADLMNPDWERFEFWIKKQGEFRFDLFRQ